MVTDRGKRWRRLRTTGGEARPHLQAHNSYQVTLTVTDDNDATDTHTETVTVTVAATTPVAFGAVGRGAGNGTTASVTVPPPVEAGDGLVLFVSVGGTGIGGRPRQGGPPEGTQAGLFHAHGALLQGGNCGRCRGAGDGEPLSAAQKMNLVVAAYSGTDPEDPIHAFASAGETTSRSGHTTPMVTAAKAGTLAVSYWSDKSSGDHLLDGPGGADGAAHLLRERWGPDLGAAHRLRVARGRRGATGGSPPPPTPPRTRQPCGPCCWRRPNRSGTSHPPPTSTCPAPGWSATSTAPARTIPTGPSTPGRGISATATAPPRPARTHTFGSADSYQVTLTVTDDGDATDTHTETVTVPSARGRHRSPERATSPRASATSRLRARWPLPKLLDSVVADHPLATVIALGDLAYPDGTPQQFACGYHPTWGRHYNRTKPAVGDHEYHTPGAAGILRILERPRRRPGRGLVQLRPGVRGTWP